MKYTYSGQSEAKQVVYNTKTDEIHLKLTDLTATKKAQDLLRHENVIYYRGLVSRHEMSKTGSVEAGDSKVMLKVDLKNPMTIVLTGNLSRAAHMLQSSKFISKDTCDSLELRIQFAKYPLLVPPESDSEDDVLALEFKTVISPSGKYPQSKTTGTCGVFAARQTKTSAPPIDMEEERVEDRSSTDAVIPVIETLKKSAPSESKEDKKDKDEKNDARALAFAGIFGSHPTSPPSASVSSSPPSASPSSPPIPQLDTRTSEYGASSS